MPAESNISDAFVPLLPLDITSAIILKKKALKIRTFEECALTFYIRYSVGLLTILARDLKSIIIDIPINGET
jgi:hypothetical protein